MSTWQAIPSFYCLNLAPNTQRWIDSVDQFVKVGISYVERIECIESQENRYISFNHSHYDTIKKGFDTGLTFGIFEDDIIFDTIYKHIAEAMNELPNDWDALYLGANICGDWKMPIKQSAHLSVLHNAWMSHAIVYSNKGARYVLDNFDPDTFPVYDEWLRINLMSKGTVYLLTPMSCYQRKGYSNVWQKEVDYIPCHIDGNKILKNL